MPSSDATYNGLRAERAAARKFGLDGAGGPGFADLVAKNGVRYQVKSTVYRRANGRPGRFRFEKSNFLKLHRCRSAVILVLFPSVGSGSGRPLRIEKVPTGDVLDEIGAAGGWNRAGHRSFEYQRRLPWPSLLDY